MAFMPVDMRVEQGGGGHEERPHGTPVNSLISNKKSAFPQLWINMLATFFH